MNWSAAGKRTDESQSMTATVCWDDAHLANAAIDVHADDPALAYRSVHDDLTVTHGRVVGLNRVASMRDCLWWSPQGRHRATEAGPVRQGALHLNHVGQFPNVRNW